jgi:hypothetical protein
MIRNYYIDSSSNNIFGYKILSFDTTNNSPNALWELLFSDTTRNSSPLGLVFGKTESELYALGY